MSLSDDEARTLAIVERVASGLSILGIGTIILVFSLSPDFRNPMHRLIFINSFYNMFDVAATMISLDGPQAGDSSALCKFQGFLNQMFPLADVLWTLAMAWDVCLIVFYRHDTRDLRKHEYKYIGVITTLVFIPAFVFLFISTPDKGPMYGSVTLWCSIAPKWVVFRIIFYYGPIWLIILITMILYILVGVEIFRRRKALSIIRHDSIPRTSLASSNDFSLDNTLTMAAVGGDAEEPQHDDDGSKQEERHDTRHTYACSTPEAPLRAGERVDSEGQTRERPSLSFRQYILMPLMFFLVLLAIWVAPTTNRVASLVNPGYMSDPLLLAVGSTGSLRGFWNGLVFVTLGMKGRRKRIQEREISSGR